MSLLRQLGAMMALLLALSIAAMASSRWDEPAAALAHKIASAAGPGAATLEMSNISSLSPEQVATIHHALEAQLRIEGIRIRQEHEAAVELRITLSENRRGWLWIAEIGLGSDSRVTMLEVPAERTAVATPSQQPMSLHATLLFSSPELLLDAQLLPQQKTITALTTHSVVLYEQQGAHWQAARELAIPLDLPLGLDPRGRLIAETGSLFNVYLPGGHCTAQSENSGAIALHCEAGDVPWPLGNQSADYKAGRNYFIGTMHPGSAHALPAFYSAAMLPKAKATVWVFAGIDGRATSFDGVNQLHLTGAANSWGSDVAALQSDCGNTELIAGQNSDDGASDALQAFEITGRDPAAVSAPLKFEGSIMALWSAPDARQATAIVRSARGEYDAYSVTLACNQ